MQNALLEVFGRRGQPNFIRWWPILMLLAFGSVAVPLAQAAPQTGPSLVGNQVTVYVISQSGQSLSASTFTVPVSGTNYNVSFGSGLSGTANLGITGNGMTISFSGTQPAPGSVNFILSNIVNSAAGVLSTHVTQSTTGNGGNGIFVTESPNVDNTEGVSISTTFVSLGANGTTPTSMSESYTFVLVAAPTITATASATGSTGTLSGTDNPNGLTNDLSFQYGLSSSYTASVVPSPAAVTGSVTTATSAQIPGLIPGGTYHYSLKSAIRPASLGMAPASSDQNFTIAPGTAVSLLGTSWTNSGTNLSLTIPAGTSRLLVVAASGGNANGNTSLNIPKVTYSAIAMTLLAKTNDVPDGGYLVDSLWYAALGDSATPTIVTIAVTTNFLTAMSSIGAYVFQGVDQTTPVRNLVGLYQPYGNGSHHYTTQNVSVVSTAGNLVLDLLDIYSGAAIPAANQTIGFAGSGDVGQTVTSSLNIGTTSTSMGWSTPSALETIQFAVDIKQATVVATVPTVTTATQSAVSASSATLGGTVTSDGTVAVTDRGIVWGLSANPTTSNTKVANGSGTGSFSATVTGLPAGTAIHVRAYAINSIGAAYGSDISFSTLSTNADLSNLVLSAGTITLDPLFGAASLSYTANASSTTSITVTPTVAQANAMVTVNTVTVASGSPSGSINLNPGANTINVVVTAQDGSTMKTYTVIVTRNSAPVVARDNATVTVNEGSTAANTGTFSDADGNATDTLTANVGTVTQNNGAGTWNWSFPTTDGPDQSQTVTITANDGTTTSTTSFSLTVNNVAPTAVGQNVTTYVNLPTNIVLAATDPGADTIASWHIAVAPTKGVLSGTAPNVTYTPNSNVGGSDSFTFTATDSDGATGPAATVNITINDHTPAVARDNATITVGEGSTAVNTGTFSDADGNASVTLSASVGTVTQNNGAGTWNWSFPTTDGPDQSQTVTITANDGIATAATTFSLTVTNIAPTAVGQTLTTFVNLPTNIVLAATDPGADTIASWNITVAPTKGVLSGTAPNVTYTPNSNVGGSDSFTFTVTDSDGATGAAATVNITINNHTPVVARDNATITVGEGSTAVNTGTFSDADGNATDTLTANVGTVTQNNSAGTWSWSFNTTSPAQSGTVTVTNTDGIATNTTTFTLTVNDVAPNAAPQSVTTPENTPASIVLTATDPGATTVASWTITLAPVNGVLSGTPPNLTYTPTNNFHGSDSFTFTATDSYGQTGLPGTVNITVSHVDQPPVAGANDITRVNNTKSVKVLLSTVLSNESDPDNDTLSITAVGSPTPAGASVVIAGSFIVYTAPATNAGNGSFTYTLSDGPGGHTVPGSVIVTEVAPAPSGVGPNATASSTSGGNNVLTFLAVPGNEYRVQYTLNPTPAYTWNDFNPVAIYTAPANGVITFVDTNPPPPARLYRAIPFP